MKWTLVVAMAVLALGVGAFEKVPEAAMTALKGVRGKNVSTGYVFVNGHYLKPPYKLARYGTAVYVNETQVTDQIVSWKSFLATQDGYAAAAAPEPEKKKAADDLFDEAPAAKVVAAEKAKAAKERDAAAAASFTANAQSKKLLKRIDSYRLEVRRALRAGNVCFFGDRYARVLVEPRLAKQLMAFLPEAMGNAANAAELEATCRSKGFPFLTRAICEDLIANRADYLLLVERRRKLQEEESLQKMFDNARGKQR